MKYIKQLLMMAVMMAGLLATTPVWADTQGTGMAGFDVCKLDANNPACKAPSKTVNQAAVDGFNFFTGIIALVGLITLVVSGPRFVISNGDAGKIKEARQMLGYGIAGIILASVAFGLVNFIIGKVLK